MALNHRKYLKMVKYGLNKEAEGLGAVASMSSLSGISGGRQTDGRPYFLTWRNAEAFQQLRLTQGHKGPACGPAAPLLACESPPRQAGTLKLLHYASRAQRGRLTAHV